MPRILYFNNPHDFKSTKILGDIFAETDLAPITETMHFMDAREKHLFRAAPTLWILPTGAIIAKKNIAIELEENFTIAQIKVKISTGRVITLTAPKTTILVNEVLRITATMKDLDGNTKPIEPVTFWLSGRVISDANGILDFSASVPGTYVIETRNTDAVQGYLEVTVQ